MLISKKRIAGAVLLGSISLVSAGAFMFGTPAGAGRDPAVAGTPYTRFMGFADEGRSQERRAAQAARATQPDPEFDRLWEEVEAARDALYQRLAADPRAQRLQERWSTCMTNAGHPFESPADVEDGGDESALTASTSCSASLRDEERSLIEEYETPWVNEHRDLLIRAEKASRGKK
jgi:hypothetical protein